MGRGQPQHVAGVKHYRGRGRLSNQPQEGLNWKEKDQNIQITYGLSTGATHK